MNQHDYAVVSNKLTKRFGPKEALCEVSLHIPRGAVYGLIGPNGAGKTTLLRCLLNLINPTSGTLTVLGKDLAYDAVAARKRLGHVAALQPLWEWMPVREFMAFMAGFYSHWNNAVIADFYAKTRIERRTRIRELSRGQRTLMSIAAQVAHEPDLLILDEALAGLDPMAKREVLQSVISVMHSENRTVLIADQSLNDLERICDHVGILVAGRLVLESPLEALKETLKRVRISHPAAAGIRLPVTARCIEQERDATRCIMAADDFTEVNELLGQDGSVDADYLSLEEILIYAAGADSWNCEPTAVYVEEMK